MKQVLILVILDGWGLGEADQSNPIYAAQPPTINFIQSNFPSCGLQASGITVGMPFQEEGNSEVGHLTLGSGRIIYQNSQRIAAAINDGSFFEKEALKKAFQHAKQNNSSVHLVGLLTDGLVHSSFEVLKALLAMAKKENVANVYLHLFTDGRDSAPKSALTLFTRLEEEIQKTGVGKVTDFCGRYFGMDRDQHWDRVKRAYDLIVNAQAPIFPNIGEALEKDYSAGLTDEFIEPKIIGRPQPIQNNDAIIFFNFREDRMRQLTEPFLNPEFDFFPIKNFQNLFIATMLRYHKQKNFEKNIVFDDELIINPLGEVLANNDKIQLRVAETEKYAHITYFFNGLREDPFLNEYRVLIPSLKIGRYDEAPQMRAEAITDRAISALNEAGFDFILVNYANPDIIAHTGNYEATVQAVKIVDKQIERLMKAVLASDHIMIITADHGNAEVLLDPQTGEKDTRHNPSPVPFYLVANKFKKPTAQYVFRLPVLGLLSDIAPTILEIMNLPRPEEMTGESLLNQIL